MDVSDLLDSLNEKQREAVAAPRSNLLVLAGAGSGMLTAGPVADHLAEWDSEPVETMRGRSSVRGPRSCS